MEFAASDSEHREPRPGAAEPGRATEPENTTEPEADRPAEQPAEPAEPAQAAGPAQAAEPGPAAGEAPAGLREGERGAFDPPEGADWTRVGSALDTYRRSVAAAVALPCGVVGAVLAWLWIGPEAAAVPAVAALAGFAAAWAAAGPARRSWGYAEGRTDLYLTYGTAVRQLVVVPYGRMQVVDVTADLLEQALGIATVRVRTAATTADTRIPGLRLEDAVVLRDRLAARSETFSTGL